MRRFSRRANKSPIARLIVGKALIASIDRGIPFMV